jgi:hypothetical protein
VYPVDVCVSPAKAEEETNVVVAMAAAKTAMLRMIDSYCSLFIDSRILFSPCMSTIRNYGLTLQGLQT